jgi:hypothetical protein
MSKGFYVDYNDNLMIWDGFFTHRWNDLVNDFEMILGFPCGSWHLIEAL